MISVKHIVYTTCISATILSSCGSKDDNGNLADLPVNVNAQTIGGSSPTQDFIQYNSTIMADKSINLTFQSSGTVMSIPVEEGQYVTKGQLIATIDPTVYQSQYDAQMAQVKLAKENYQRILAVYQKGSVAEIKMLSAKSDYEAATASAKAVYQNIAHTKLYAPQNGYIGKKMIEVGATAGPSVAIVSLVDIQGVSVHVPIPENEINQYKVGDYAKVLVNAVDKKTFNGKISKISVVSSQSSPVYTVEVYVNNAEKLLKPGMSCQVTFDATQRSNTFTPSDIILPEEAVQIDDNGKNFVYVTKDGKKAETKVVQIGQLYNNGISITGGLQVGDRVITSGFHKITNGSSIVVNH